MFDKLKSMFAAETVSDDDDVKFDASDYRLAEAALMFHVIAADGKITTDERERMNAVLKSEFELSDEEVSELYIAAQNADNESVDLYRFTSLLKKKFDREERIAIIENLWEMVFADGILHEFEDNVVWRVAQLLEVETNDRIAMKQRVRARREN